MGVVYYANFFVWFEIGRVELLRQLGFDYKRMEVLDDCLLPVVDATCRYKSPARYDDLIVIETRVSAMRTTVLKFAYNIYRAGDALDDGSETPEKLLAIGETTHVIVDKSLEKSTLPERYAKAIRAAFGEQLVPRV